MNDLFIRVCCSGSAQLHAIRVQAAALASRIHDLAILKSWPVRFLWWVMVQILIMLCGLSVGILMLIAQAYWGMDGDQHSVGALIEAGGCIC